MSKNFKMPVTSVPVDVTAHRMETRVVEKEEIYKIEQRKIKKNIKSR